MLTERWKLRIMHAVISLLIASVGSVGIALLALYGSALYFDHKYPHDGQNALGAFVVALMALPVAWVGLFVLTIFLLGWWARRREQKELAEHSGPRFTITGQSAD